jgi:serine/threonine-protein kinase HipA
MDKINVVEVFLDGNRVGRIALTEQSICAFEYDTEFLKTGFSISPYYLPLRSGLFVASRNLFRGDFGVFDDSLPDGFGKTEYAYSLLARELGLTVIILRVGKTIN